MTTPNIEMVDATTAHLDELALNMRDSDVREVMAMSDRGIRTTLQLSFDMSSRVESCLIDGRVAAVWGIAPIDGEVGVPWMLGTPLIDLHPKVLISESKRQLRLMLNEFNHLQQWVDIRNEASVRWLRRLGFLFGDPQPIGLGGELFYPFEYHKDV